MGLNSDLIEWIILKCAYCEQESNLRDYHWQYKMKVSNDKGVIISNPKVLAICPKCKKTNIVEIKLKNSDIIIPKSELISLNEVIEQESKK